MLIRAEALRRLVAEIFTVAGCADDEAARIAEFLVRSNLTGHDSHGVIRVPRYLQWMSEGRVFPNRSMTVVLDTPALAVVEGNFGFGQTVGPQAVRLGIEKAQKGGAAVVALRHSGHLGRIGDWAEMAAEAGLVSIHLVNVSGSQLVAPFGGVERRMATNPVAMGVPRPGGPPVILDFATSLVAEGKALVAYDGGKPLPPGSLIDDEGRLTNDPAVFYGPRRADAPAHPSCGSGALRAMGEHKGSGLSFMIELLAGALTGSGCAGPGPRPLVNGMLSIFLDPKVVDTEHGFAAEVRQYVDFVKSTKPAAPGGEVLIPGEPELRSQAARGADGIPLPDNTWREILAGARRAGLSQARIDAVLAGG